MFQQWLIMASNIYENENVICPSCNSSNIDYQYIGDISTRIGYLDVWCNNCMHGIHISRVKIPSGVNFLSFDDEDKIINRIPNYKQITP